MSASDRLVGRAIEFEDESNEEQDGVSCLDDDNNLQEQFKSLQGIDSDSFMPNIMLILLLLLGGV